jgi:hypothetical protein
MPFVIESHLNEGSMKAYCILLAAGLLAFPAMAQSAPSSRAPKTEYYNTTADYVRDCGGPAASLVPCMTVFGVVQTAVGHPTYCAPDTSTRDPEEGRRKYTALIISVVGWLKKHPEYSSRPYAEGLNAALKGQYPCK